MTTLDNAVSFQGTNYLVKLLQLETGTDAPNLKNSLQNLVKKALFWRKRLIRKLFPLPNVPWNREKWFLLNTNPNQHFSGENAYARDKTFHARDLAVPRVNRNKWIGVNASSQNKNAWSKELSRKARRPRQPFSCASFKARHARGFPIYIDPLRDPRGQFLLTYVWVN